MVKSMKERILTIALLIVLLITLDSCEFYGNKDLGNKLTLFARDSPEGHYDIVYCSKYDIGGCIAGIYVLPTADDKYYMYVKSAKSNDKWVVAKTIRTADQKENYWIISKDFSLENVDCNSEDCDSIIQSHVTGALDNQEFITKTKELGIDLKFEE
jgi:hypothetical protein